MRTSLASFPVPVRFFPFRQSLPVPNQINVPHTNAAVYTVPVYLPSDVSTISVRVGNKGRVGNAGNSVTSNIAIYKSDGTGVPTGSPLAQYNSQTVPGDGTVLTLSNIPVTRGTDGKICIVFSVPGSTTVAYVDNTNYGLLADLTQTVNPAPGGTASPVHVFWWQIDYSTARPRINWFGDSISIGSGSGTIPGPMQCAAVLLAVAKDYAVSSWGSNAAAFGDYAVLSADAIWTSNANAFIELCVNDVTVSGATMYSRLQTVFNSIKASTGGKVYANTCSPIHLSIYNGSEANQAAYNTLVLPNTIGLDGIYDRGASQASGGLASNTDSTSLAATYDCGDHLHFSVAGQAADKAGVQAIILL